jgi:hypothetical protein
MLVLLLLSMPIASRISIVEERGRFEGGRITDRGCRSSENYNYVVLPLAIVLAMIAQKLGDVTSHSVGRNHRAANHSPPQLTSHDLSLPACILPQLTESVQAPLRWTMLAVSLITWIG